MAAAVGSIQEDIDAKRKQVEVLERKVDDLENVTRVRQHLSSEKVSSGYLKIAPSDYYSWSLEQRANFLQCQIPHLCKSIIVENTSCTQSGTQDRRNSKYYCVVLQYNSKLNTEHLMRFVRDLLPESERPGRKSYNFQHAPAQVSDDLTGFKHNGVSPFGMKTSIPVIVAGDVSKLPFLWLGGGAESVKLRISVQDLIRSLHADVAPNVTTLRTDI